MSPTDAAAPMKRRLAVLAAALFAVAVGYGQVLSGQGQSPAEFAADSDATLKAAGWAFAIWGLIYLGLLAYAVRQALPRTSDSPTLRRLGWPSAAALAGIGAWVIAAALDLETLTIVLIFASALVLIAPLAGGGPMFRALPARAPDRWLGLWPVAALAGWLTIAAPLNLITVLTGNGDLPAGASPTSIAQGAVVAVALVGVAMAARLRTLAYPLPIAWGLVGVFAAEQARNPALATTAVGAAAAVLAASVLLAALNRRRA